MSQSLTLRGDLVSVQNTPLGPCSITFHRDVVTVDVTIPTDPEQDGSDSARISIDYRDVVKVMVRETRVCVMLKGPWDTFGGIEVEDLSSSSIKTVFSFSSPDDCDQMVRAVTEYGELAVIQLSAPIASTSAQSGIVRPKVSTTLCSIVRGVVPRTPSAPPAPVLDEEENLPPHSDESVGGPITAKSPSKGFVDVDDHQGDASVSDPPLTKHKSSVQVPEEVREEEEDDDEDDEVTEQKPDDDNNVCVTTPHMVDALLQLQQEQLAFHQEGVQLIEEGEALQWSEMIKSFRDGKRKILAKIPPKKHTGPSEPKKKRKQSEHQNDASMTVVLSSSCVVTQPPPCVLAVLEKLEMEHMEEYSEILRQELQARCNFIPKHAALTRALTHTEWLSGWKVFQRNEKEERALLVCRMTSTCTPKVVKPNNNNNNSNNNAFSFAASVVTPQLSNRIGPKQETVHHKKGPTPVSSDDVPITPPPSTHRNNRHHTMWPSTAVKRVRSTSPPHPDKNTNYPPPYMPSSTKATTTTTGKGGTEGCVRRLVTEVGVTLEKMSSELDRARKEMRRIQSLLSSDY